MRRISTHQYKSVTIYTRGFHEPEGEQSYKDPLFITSKIITALADTNLAQMDITQLPFKDGYKDLWSPTRNSTVCLAKLHQCPKTTLLGAPGLRAGIHRWTPFLWTSKLSKSRVKTWYCSNFTDPTKE